MKIRDIIAYLEELAPLQLQESYDNSGLQVGHPETEVEGVLIALDVDARMISEAKSKGCGLIISHHPVIFKPLRRLTGGSLAETIVEAAIREGIALYAIHTNLDNAAGGLNQALAGLIGLQGVQVLQPGIVKLQKLITYCPEEAVGKVMEAMAGSGAGQIGRYDHCSFQTAGEGTFRALDGANPYVGTLNQLHREREVKLEMIVREYEMGKVIRAMKGAHPYEEVAYDVVPLANTDPGAGAGAWGTLSEPQSPESFLSMIKDRLGAEVLRHSVLPSGMIRKVAVCGGSGGFLTDAVIRAGMDAFITGDLKYHQFADASDSLLLVDAGHFETEIMMTSVIMDAIRKKFPTFACSISEHARNPVKYT
ncbi:MAG: Nif3-like dinuclear metal center hexameric protein [Bacteroidales bacterium]